MRQIALVAPIVGFLGGCASLSPSDRIVETDPLPESLTLVVAQLKLHLQDDTYRFDRATGPDGGNVYAVSLWKLDRLAAARARPEGEWQNADYVIEFARGKALERLRRYDEAALAYRRVAGSGSVLGDAAAEPLRIAERFAQAAAAATEPFPSEADELRFVEARIATWRALASEVRNTPQESLAREEAEAWGVLRVDALARSGQHAEAISACRALVESNRESKRFGKHLLRLGDLYADAARREMLAGRTQRARFDAARYDALVDQAFSAYELAGEDHKESLRHEARTRIDALLAYHDGVRAHAP